MSKRHIQLAGIAAATSILTACAATTAEAGASEAEARKAEDTYVAVGEPVDCIQINRITSTRVRDDKTIDFLLGSKIYRNTLPNRCPSLGFEERFSYATSINQLCNVDIIHVLYTTGGGGLQKGAGCGLGQFQQVEKVEKPAN